MPDTRTIINVTKPFAMSPDPAKQGEIHVTMSDGSDGESAGIVERTEDGAIVQRVALRTPNGLDDGPIYTPFVCFMMRQLGATVPDVGAVHPAIVLAPSPTLPAPIPPTTTVTIPALPENATPAQHASRLHSIMAALEGGAMAAVHGAETAAIVAGTVAAQHPEVVAALAPKASAYITIFATIGQMFAAKPNA